MAGRDPEKEAKLMDNPTEFFLDFLEDMFKAFKEGFTGQSQKKKDPQEQMQEMMKSMMQMFEGMQKMQMQQMQMQMQQMQNPKPQNGNKGPEAQPQNQQQGVQQQNMQMPNMQNMQNMINGMQNMQMPNMQLQANDPNSLMMNIVMTITQTMINGMMQYMQMRNPQNQQQMQQQEQQQMQQQQQQNQQEQQQMQQQNQQQEQQQMQQQMQQQQQQRQQNQQERQNQPQRQQDQQRNRQEQPLSRDERKKQLQQEQRQRDQQHHEWLNNLQNRYDQQDLEEGDEPPQIMQDDVEMVDDPENQQGPRRVEDPELKRLRELEKEIDKEGKIYTEEKNRAEYDRFQAESDIWRINFHNEDLAEKEKKIGEIDQEIERLSNKKDQQIQKAKAEQKELDDAVNEGKKLTEDRDKAKSDIEKDDPGENGPLWSDKEMIEAEKSLNGLDAEKGPKDVQDAAKSFGDTYKDYSSKMIAEGNNALTASDNLKMYEAAKKFVDATNPEKKGNENLSPKMKEARKSAENLINKMDDISREKLMEAAKKEKMGLQSANARKPGMKWFSDAELNKAIMSLENMRNEGGEKLDPAAGQFQNDLMDLKENIRKDPKGMHIDNYLKLYDSADKFMQESAKNGKTGKDMDVAKAVAGTVRKRLDENKRIDKLRTISEYQQKKEMNQKKINELQERNARNDRSKQINGIENLIQDAKNRKDVINDEKFQSVRKQRDEAQARHDEALARKNAANKKYRENRDKYNKNARDMEKRKDEIRQKKIADAKAKRAQTRNQNKNMNNTSVKKPNVKVGAM